MTFRFVFAGIATLVFQLEGYSQDQAVEDRTKVQTDFTSEIRTLNAKYDEAIKKLQERYTSECNKKIEIAVEKLDSLEQLAKTDDEVKAIDSTRARIRKTPTVPAGTATVPPSAPKSKDDTERKLSEAKARIKELEKIEKMYFSSAGVKPQIPPNAIAWGGHHYFVLNEASPYFSATLKCAVVGGHLLRIDNAQEHEFIRTLVKDSTAPNYWVDGSDELKEGEWRYSNGMLMTYNSWARGEPNAGKGGNFCTLWRGGDWFLGDNGGGDENFIICEWDF